MSGLFVADLAHLDLRPKNPIHRELRCKHHAQLADTLIRMGRPSGAATAARELSRFAPDDPAMLLRAARLFVHCATLPQRNRERLGAWDGP
jgi:hypothetical protein